MLRYPLLPRYWPSDCLKLSRLCASVRRKTIKHTKKLTPTLLCQRGETTAWFKLWPKRSCMFRQKWLQHKGKPELSERLSLMTRHSKRCHDVNTHDIKWDVTKLRWAAIGCCSAPTNLPLTFPTAGCCQYLAVRLWVKTGTPTLGRLTSQVVQAVNFVVNQGPPVLTHSQFNLMNLLVDLDFNNILLLHLSPYFDVFSIWIQCRASCWNFWSSTSCTQSSMSSVWCSSLRPTATALLCPSIIPSSYIGDSMCVTNNVILQGLQPKALDIEEIVCKDFSSSVQLRQVACWGMRRKLPVLSPSLPQTWVDTRNLQRALGIHEF